MQSTAIFHQRSSCPGFIQKLGESCRLEMVQIPAGSFTMGAPEEEVGSESNERPQHIVHVPQFFMSKYPVTQAQWYFVAGLPEDSLNLDPDPSYFKGDDNPVESISWLDAVEFCQYLSTYTRRDYRLPTEAEWEYACRAGTTTPFHYGETITSELANYDWSQKYIKRKGVNLEKSSQGTTPVGSFGVANAFGLYDMHGNVWEWCQDHWHENYENTPVDGSAWLDDDNAGSFTSRRVLRGGAWDFDPEHCRSANRLNLDAGYVIKVVGFRVVCSIARSL